MTTKELETNVKKNWKTTAASIVVVLGGILTQAGAFLDDDPTTVVDTAKLFGFAVAIAGILGWGYFTADKKPAIEESPEVPTKSE